MRTKLSMAGCLLVLSGCFPQSTIDVTPPRVVGVSPSELLLPVSTRFEVQFSEPMNVNEEVMSEHTVVLVERVDATESFIGDVNSPPLSDTNYAKLVPLERTVADGDQLLILTPEMNLRPSTAYSLLLSEDLRDAEGNPLASPSGSNEHFRFDFTTDAGPPTILTDDIGNSLVPPNRRRFTVTMNQSVQGANKDNISIALREGGGNVSIESIALDETRSVVTVLLDEVEGCEILAPDSDYILTLDNGIRDDAGRSLVPVDIEFTTSGECQLSRNRISGVDVVATDVRATVSVSSTQEASAKLWYGIAGDDLDCLGQTPCPVVDNNIDSAHGLEVSGLTIDETYAFRVAAEDDYGSVAVAEGSFTTAELPKVAINEFFADPDFADVDENEAEFIEIANYGEASVDLVGHFLTVGDGAPCDLTDRFGDDLIVAPGSFLVLAGSAFDASLFPSLDDSLVRRANVTSGCGSLVNSESRPMLLEDSEGRPVSSFAGYSFLEPNDAPGSSVERVTVSDGDAADNFCFSRGAATPGETNSVTLLGCETDPGSQ